MSTYMARKVTAVAQRNESGDRGKWTATRTEAKKVESQR